QTNKIYAMKVLKKASLILHLKDAEHTKTERQILEEVRHPFIVDLYFAFQTKEKLFLLLTFAAGGELFSYLQKEKMFDEDTAMFYLCEIFLALEHLHSLGIIYRDLKPENILLDHEGHTLLTDFGLSKVSVETKTLCGSLEYMAPEIILTDTIHNITYDKLVDYWSFGILCHDLLTGKTPFNGNNHKKVMDAILKKKLILPNYLTTSAKNLIIRLLRKNPAVRLGSKKGAEEVKTHIFFRKINWNKVYNKEIIPPIIPIVNDPEDLSNFNSQFTKMSTDSIMIDSISATSLNNSGLVSENNGINSINSSRYDLFRGFSYVADLGL
ncbi:kinase-like protein, partial [Piromyces finnis]